MTRFELYQEKIKHGSRKGQLFFLFFCMIVLSGLLVFKHYHHNTIQIKTPSEDPGKKVAVHLPNGHEVYTYEKYIVHKNGKTYYKGDSGTIDLTGGKIIYENWK